MTAQELQRKRLKSALGAMSDALTELQDAGDLLRHYEEARSMSEPSTASGWLEEARARIELAAKATRGELRRLDFRPTEKGETA